MQAGGGAAFPSRTRLRRFFFLNFPAPPAVPPSGGVRLQDKNMRKPLLFLIAFLFVGVSFAHADDWSHSWNVGEKPEFEFHSNDAGIDITAMPGKTIDARVETKGYRIADDDVRITQRQDGDRVSLEVHVAPHHFMFGI